MSLDSNSIKKHLTLYVMIRALLPSHSSSGLPRNRALWRQYHETAVRSDLSAVICGMTVRSFYQLLAMTGLLLCMLLNAYIEVVLAAVAQDARAVHFANDYVRSNPTVQDAVEDSITRSTV